MKNVLWSYNVDIDVEEEKVLYEEANGCELSDGEVYDIAYETNELALDDLRRQLDVRLDGKILLIAKLGLWDGKHHATKKIPTGNIKDILYSSESPTWYIEDGELWCEDSHHDGTNFYLYREIIDEDKAEEFIDSFVYGGKDYEPQELNSWSRSLAQVVSQRLGLTYETEVL